MATIKYDLPLIPLRDVVVFPGVVSTLFVFIVSIMLGLVFSDYNEFGIIFSDMEYLLAYFINLVGFFSFCLFIGILVKRSAFALGFLLIWSIIEGIIYGFLKWEMFRNSDLADNIIQLFPLASMSNLIKEPFLSYYIPQLFETFPMAKFILIVRNPFQNIRSILNRLEIPGDLENINFNDYDEIKKTPVWKLALQSNMFGLKSSNYIESMANRWNYVVNSYLSNSNNIVIVKYEEFLQNKADFIQRLIKDINLDYVQDIKYKTEIQYQKKGNSDVDLSKFFGDNYEKIERICKINMNKIGY